MTDIPQQHPEAHSAVDIAAALAEAEGTKPQAPTPEQQRVIEAPAAPILVVAGAGSGKTHTMAQRVLWLVANGHAAPDQVLGLTFTRKAARELQVRLDEQLTLLGTAGLVDPALVATHKPVVQTYNSFASSLFREWALLIGRDPESEVLTDPAALLLALRVARASDDLRLATLGSANQIAQRVLQLAGELGDHRVGTAQLRASGFAAAFASLAELPPDPDERALTKGARDDIAEDARRVGALDVLADLVDAFDAQKRSLGVVQFSDQVRLALDAIDAHPGAIDDLRSRHRFVLLDEFQDTSVLQLQLLSTIFTGEPVMAVGDPNQAIYGFRGASAGTLALFAERFGATATMSLSTSWRNDAGILDVAHSIASGLPEQPGVPVERLTPRTGAGIGEVSVRHVSTLDQEAEELAGWLREHGAGFDGGPATAALLVRTHAQGIALADALRALGVKVARWGGGGLLEEPAVVDLVAALRVLGKPEEGSSLVRLLAGSRWRIGVADLMALQRHARRLAAAGLTDEQRARDRSAVVAEASASIIDALDSLADGAALEGVTAEGLERMREAAQLLRRLRRRAGMPLPELVRSIEQALRLDIEVGANPGRDRAVLDAFAREAHAFAAADHRGSLGAFLDYLEAVERGRGPDAPQRAPERGVVQILTMHASKGLEWDLVALPRLAFTVSDPRSKGWLDWAKLPYELRGDRRLLSQHDWQQRTAHGYRDARADFLGRLAEHEQSERDRLSYVAVTRARKALWLSAAQWYGTGPTPSRPDRLLELVAADRGVDLLPPATKADGNPRVGVAPELVWPVDPLGGRREAVERAAARIESAEPERATRWDAAIRLLLADRVQTSLSLPSRIAASGFKDWAADPVAVAKQIARPMPQQPFAATRLGTLFHGWVERRDGAIGLGDAVDDAALDEELVGIDAERLERLKQTFLASSYGDRQPAETEIEIHLPLAGTTVVCKIDAVYRDGDRATVVDWKTGRLPSGDADLEARQLQLALYRAAYAAHAGLDPEQVDAELYFVEHDRVIRPERIESLAELEARWLAAQQAVAEASALG
ncbi:ATP-dependent DNA helicase [Agrococcus sp. ARC_14]|uniref:ATP-dependent DNA helicase n=1 Tax=Agrococcus sp. ARC_14 TaxID=2919927 RepID=UPI001F06B82D|nr:ATP-dependent DNA helicase [Agrococcus sp. ARC_14]MCH1882629.1 ATP-dependent helicase [Agrococcus sp. ARC_14]